MKSTTTKPRQPKLNVRLLRLALRWLLGAEHQSRTCHQPFSAGWTPCVCGLAEARDAIQKVLSSHFNAKDLAPPVNPIPPSTVTPSETDGEIATKVARQLQHELEQRRTPSMTFSIMVNAFAEAIRKSKAQAQVTQGEDGGFFGWRCVETLWRTALRTPSEPSLKRRVAEVINELFRAEVSAGNAAGADTGALQKDEIRRAHAQSAAHNEGLVGMPQGPCQCEICTSPSSAVLGGEEEKTDLGKPDASTESGEATGQN